MADSGLRLMAVHAHADDETITMGGTLAALADRGVRTCVVCCTDGKLATIVDPDMPEETTRPRLTEIREAELREACRILHVDEVEFLRYGDSGMADTPTNQLPDAFWMTPLHEATGRIVAEIRRFRPQVVVTYDANGGYGHPDHIRSHDVAVRAFARAGDWSRRRPVIQASRSASAAPSGATLRIVQQRSGFRSQSLSPWTAAWRKGFRSSCPPSTRRR